jgi:hypothetical protein
VSESIGPAEAIKELQINQVGNYNLQLIQDFKKVLKSEGILDLE